MELETKKRQKYITPRQKKKLIELMAKHPELISCKVTQDFNYKDSQRLWQSIAIECNSIQHGARKTWRQWRKTWHDMRSKTKKRQSEGTNTELLVSTVRLTAAEQEALGIKNIKASEFQESTEFIPLDGNSDQVFNEEMSESLSGPESPPEAKVFNSTPTQKSKLHNSKPSSKHKCYFNCDVIAVQEQRKIQMKESYLTFKKDYLRQKLKLLKEQTEALKSIAKELSK